MGRIILVTGVSGTLGGRLSRALASDPAVDRVIGVDVVPPRTDIGAVRFVRADIRNPVIAKVITGEDVDTVVHSSIAAAASQVVGRASAKEHNVIGTMQLLAACQRAPGLQRLVVKSSSDVYGSSNRDPAMFTEDMGPRRVPQAGFSKDMLEIEGYVRGFFRRRPDVTVTTLRHAPLLSPELRTPLADYFSLNPIPKVIGYDARLQLLHYDDLVAVLHHTALAGVPGTFNIAGAGIIPISQAIRKLGRMMLPLPGFAMSSLGSAVRQARVALPDFASSQVAYLTYGRGMDTTRMRSVLGFEPTYNTEQTLSQFAAHHTPGLLPTHPVVTVENFVMAALGGGRNG